MRGFVLRGAVGNEGMIGCEKKRCLEGMRGEAEL